MIRAGPVESLSYTRLTSSLRHIPMMAFSFPSLLLPMAKRGREGARFVCVRARFWRYLMKAREPLPTVLPLVRTLRGATLTPGLGLKVAWSRLFERKIIRFHRASPPASSKPAVGETPDRLPGVFTGVTPASRHRARRRTPSRTRRDDHRDDPVARSRARVLRRRRARRREARPAHDQSLPRVEQPLVRGAPRASTRGRDRGGRLGHARERQGRVRGDRGRARGHGDVHVDGSSDRKVRGEGGVDRRADDDDDDDDDDDARANRIARRPNANPVVFFYSPLLNPLTSPLPRLPRPRRPSRRVADITRAK